MTNDIFESEIAAMDALDGKYRYDGARLSAEKVLHDAVADVQEGLQFWKTIARNTAAQHHASREFLNRQG